MIDPVDVAGTDAGSHRCDDLMKNLFELLIRGDLMIQRRTNDHRARNVGRIASIHQAHVHAKNGARREPRGVGFVMRLEGVRSGSEDEMGILMQTHCTS